MTLSPIERRFLDAMQRSHQKVVEHGVRSNEKTKVLHGWVQDEMRRELGNEYEFIGQTPNTTKEARVRGMYYDKYVDVLIARAGQELGVISIKSVISNYRQNSVNYIEQQIGETANLRRKNIVYGNLFCVTNPIPYKNRGGEIKKLERLRDNDILRYADLRADQEHAHAPNEMAIGIVDIDVDRDEVIGITDPLTLDLSVPSLAALQDALSVSHFFSRMARRIQIKYISP